MAIKGGRSQLLHPQKDVIDLQEYRKLQQETMLENDFQNNVIDAARKFGWHVYHVYDVQTATERGFPDLVLLREGECIYAELKKANGRLSDEQVEWLRLFKTIQGNEVVVWRPADYDGVIARLARRKAV